MFPSFLPLQLCCSPGPISQDMDRGCPLTGIKEWWLSITSGEDASKLLPSDKGPSIINKAPRDTYPSILLPPASVKYSALAVYVMHPFLWYAALGHAFLSSKFILALASPLRFSYFSWWKMPFFLFLSLWLFMTVPWDKMKCVGIASQPFLFS